MRKCHWIFVFLITQKKKTGDWWALSSRDTFMALWIICFPGLPLHRRNTAKLIFCWDAQKQRQTYTSTSCCSRKLAVFSFITSFLFPVSLAGAPSPRAWWLDPRLKIPIINLHHDKLRKSAAFLFLSSLSLSYFPLPLCLPLSALSFIPHKHMRYGAVLMRTEWTDPRPQRHRGPPPQIRRRYQFSGVLFKRPQCGIPNTSVLCSTIPLQIPRKLPLCLFLQSHCRNADVLPFFFSPSHVHPGNAFCKESAVKLLTIPCLVLWLHHRSQYWYSIWCPFSTWRMRSFTHHLPH